MICYLIEESTKFQPVADEAMFVSSGAIEPIDETLDPLEILIAREERAQYTTEQMEPGSGRGNKERYLAALES